MNILFVSELSNLGGGETSLLNLMLEFKNSHKDINQTLMCFSEGKLTKESRENNIDTIIYDINDNINKGKFINIVNRIKNIIKNKSIDVIQTNEWKTAVIFSFINKVFFLKSKVIWVCHGQWYRFNFFKKCLINIFIDNIISVSKNVKDNLIINNVKSKIITHIPLGIDIEKYKNGDNNKIRKELGISDKEKIFAVIGRFQEIKGQKLVIESVNILKNQGIRCKILFVGDSIFNKCSDDLYKIECLDLIKKYDIEEYFYFLGVRRDINDILKGIDALIVPSINESFGMVVIEAYASSCLVISTPCDGPKEIIKNGHDSYILTERNSECLAGKLIEIVNVDEGIKKIKLNQKNAILRYSIKNICIAYREIYNI